MRDDDRLVSLDARRAERSRAARKASLARFKPSYSLAVWLALLTFAVLTYLAFGRSGAVITADMSAGMHTGGISECGLIRRTCLVDGDTGWQDGTKWRLQNIDAPEMDDKAQCSAEREKARTSLARLIELMAGGYIIKSSGRNDRYGRALVDITLRDGRNVGQVLMAEGLAQPWPNTGNVWCDF
jgi:endonuclease YncB( thermonuclease family)